MAKSSILVACSLGRSLGLLVVASMSSPAFVFNCMSGLTLAFRTNISWFGFNVLTSLPISLLAVASWSCTVSSTSNSLAINSWSFVERVSASCISRKTLDAGATSSPGNNSSSRTSVSSMRGNNTLSPLFSDGIEDHVDVSVIE